MQHPEANSRGCVSRRVMIVSCSWNVLGSIKGSREHRKYCSPTLCMLWPQGPTGLVSSKHPHESQARNKLFPKSIGLSDQHFKVSEVKFRTALPDSRGQIENLERYYKIMSQVQDSYQNHCQSKSQQLILDWQLSRVSKWLSKKGVGNNFVPKWPPIWELKLNIFWNFTYKKTKPPFRLQTTFLTSDPASNLAFLVLITQAKNRI